MAIAATVVHDAAGFTADDRAQWDALAVASGRPCSLSAWMLGGLAHLANAQLHLVLLHEDGTLLGGAAFLRGRWDGRLWIEAYPQLGWNFGHDVDPLAIPGRERDVAAAVAGHFATLQPRASMLTVSWAPEDSPWPGLLRRAWHGRLQHRVEARQVSPVVTMAADLPAWRATKSRNFRDTIKRKTKATEKRGGRVRRSDDPEVVAEDIRQMLALHHARFAAMGKTSNLTEDHREALLDAAPGLLAGGHLRLWVVEHEGRVVGAQVHLRAGERMYFYNGGMHPDWEREALGLVLLHAAVEDAHGLGVRTLDLGPGAFAYKLRFADTEHRIAAHDLFVVDRRWPLVRARLARKHAEAAARHRVGELPDQRRAQLKRLLGR